MNDLYASEKRVKAVIVVFEVADAEAEALTFVDLTLLQLKKFSK